MWYVRFQLVDGTILVCRNMALESVALTVRIVGNIPKTFATESMPHAAAIVDDRRKYGLPLPMLVGRILGPYAPAQLVLAASEPATSPRPASHASILSYVLGRFQQPVLTGHVDGVLGVVGNLTDLLGRDVGDGFGGSLHN